MTTCLVIDEAPIVLKVASRILDQVDVAVSGAADMAEAEGLLATVDEAPALVILSATLSGTTVDASVRALRARLGSGPTILVSLVEADLGAMTRAKRAGANGFVYRPFERRSLLAWTEPFLTVAA